jgi:flagellar basal-body rod protein FlgG
MNDALYIAATGMQTHQKSVDTISNNIANLNTAGFKKSKVSFDDMVYRDLASAEAAVAGGVRVMQGSGVSVASIVKSFAAAELRRTDTPTDLAIRGDGFLEVTGADGQAMFSRGGTLTIDKDGMLATATGELLRPDIHVGKDVQQLVIQADGHVMARGPGEKRLAEVGRIEMVRFADLSGLEAIGSNLYRASARSGDPISGVPGEDGMGTLVQGHLEASNVNLVEEMIDLMVAQRAYESSVKVIQASDEMLAMSNSLRK